MLSLNVHRSLRGVVAALAVALFAVSALPVGAVPWGGDRDRFASPRFEEVWRSADMAVQQGRTTRSWTWGPKPWFDYKEIYKQSPKGLRQVQYFDKARMEINDPRTTSGPLGGVTNGLLVVELVSGRIKLGDDPGPAENFRSSNADIPVAGNPPLHNQFNLSTPVYANFVDIATVDNGYRDPSKIGQRVGTTLARQEPYSLNVLSRGFRQDLAELPGTDIVAYEPATGHNIPRVFHDFIDAGPVARIVAFGHPISDAYWITARVGEQDKDVLVQLFERRTVTYTPSNPAAFRVEMGNVGQHYFSWRYQALGQPWTTPDPSWNIVYASKTDGSTFQMAIVDPNGTNLFASGFGGLPYSVHRNWASFSIEYVEAPCTNGKRQIANIMPPKPNFFSNCSDNSYDPAISPDGNLLAFVSDVDGNPELYLMGGGISLGGIIDRYRLTDTTGCSVGRPSWLPDGSGLIYESNCEGSYALYRGNLSFTVEGEAKIAVAGLISPWAGEAERLTNDAANERWPRVSPDGSQIVFFSDRDGNNEIYTVMVDGSRQTRLTNNSARDEGPVWSPDGKQIVFNSDHDGDHELYIMKSDGSALRRLTQNNVDDGYAVWGP